MLHVNCLITALWKQWVTHSLCSELYRGPSKTSLTRLVYGNPSSSIVGSIKCACLVTCADPQVWTLPLRDGHMTSRAA